MSEGRVEKRRQRQGITETALQNQLLIEYIAGRMGQLAIVPLDLLVSGKLIGNAFWGEQLTKHINSN